MPKRLIIGISVALVLLGAAALTVLLVRSRALGDAVIDVPPPSDGPVRPDGGSGMTPRPEAPPQEGPCGDGACSAGESWCVPDCGSKEERFLGSIKAEEITPTSLVLTWKTDAPTTGEVAYGTSELYEKGTVASAALATVHRAELRGLPAGSNVLVRLTVTEADGSKRDVGPLGFELPGAAR